MTQAVTLAGLGSTTPTIVSPTLTSPVLGTPVSGSLVNCTDVNYTGFKNRIINGGMVIDQRNAGASVTPANGAVTYTLDRYAFYVNQASKLTVQQSTTVPAGFKNSMVITSSSAYSSGSGDIFVMFQSIEGLNVSDLGWGAAGASAVTVSFWTTSSLTGTHSGALSNAGNSRSYPFTFTISAANTWEYKTIAVAGDTSGTWLTTNSTGITLKFNCGSGTSALGTANSWASADYSGATGSVSLVGTSGATLYITGVQLEKGSVATSFDYRPYGTELSLCQRYYQKMGLVNATGLGVGISKTTSTADIVIALKVSMRAAPTITQNSLYVSDGSSYNSSVSSITSQLNNADSIRIVLNTAATMIAQRTAQLTCNTSSGYLDMTSEL